MDYFTADVVSYSDYLPFGQIMPNRHGSEGSYRYSFNTQEKVYEISGEGNHTTAMYWEYDTRLGRRWNMDPIVKPWESSYSCFGGNPIYFSDPLGDDYGIKTRKDSKGKIKSITVRATVYIQGPGASDKRAEELNKEAKKVFKSETVDGVQVNIHINYVYNAEMKPENLNVGENLLVFKAKQEDNRPAGERNLNNVSGITRYYDHTTGNTGVIMNSGKNNNTILHESLHLLGLSDRYDANTGEIKDKHYKDDIMARRGTTKLSLRHYKNIVLFVKREQGLAPYDKQLKKHPDHPSHFLFGNKVLDENEKGNLRK